MALMSHRNVHHFELENFHLRLHSRLWRSWHKNTQFQKSGAPEITKPVRSQKKKCILESGFKSIPIRVDGAGSQYVHGGFAFSLLLP